MHGVDWLPTLCEAVGISCEHKQQQRRKKTKLDGMSLWKYFDPTSDVHRSFENYPARQGFIYGQHDGGMIKHKPSS